jgi:hypothetical protein
MKRAFAIAAVAAALLSGGVAHALGPLGVLTADKPATGSVSAGGGVFRRELGMDPKKADYSKIRARQSGAYAQLAQEVFGWEWTVRAGMTDFSDGAAFDAGYKPFVGLGLKGYILGDQADTFGLTACFRADVYSRYKVDGVFVAPGQQTTVRVKDLWDAEAGLMAHTRFGRLTMYGGPMLHYAEAKVYRTVTVPVGIDMTEDSYFKTRSPLGFAGGLAWQKGDLKLGFEAGGISGSYETGLNASIAF